MIRVVAWSGVLCLVITVLPADVFGQFNPSGNKSNQKAAAGADPRLRRAAREQAVAAVGPVARDFVESLGDEAVAAIFACSKPVAVRLAEFYASGEMNRFPRPRDLLRTIAQPRNGDEVALWALQHVSELMDRDFFDAYLLNPLEYALGLKELSAGAAEVRAWRLNQGVTPTVPAPAGPSANNGWLVIAGIFGVLVLVWFLLRRRNQSPVC
jgi:LPXTG-motif cell wall-anchored protein